MKTVKLTTPLSAGAKGLVDSFTFREPLFEDFMELGDPRVPIISGDRFVWQPVPKLIKDYAERLLHGGDLNILAGASLKDSIAIQETVVSFFSDLDPPKSSAGSDGTSSSSAGKTSEASAD